MIETLLLDKLATAAISWWQLPLALLVGVLTSFTPCVYPILPITLATLTQQRHQRFAPFVYCLGFAAIYAALGFIAAWTGSLFGQVATNPWVLLVFANVLLYFAAVTKGFLTLPALPSTISNTHSAPLLMGMASALVAAPCTSPVLGGLLLYVANAQQPILGAALLFSFALGMSSLLLIAGLSTRFIAKLPKSGPWLKHITTLTALLLLAMAQYFLIQAGKSWL
ncbi:sulfite exporter TauE/SafE family protein [Pseudoalteromonas xiamenensis]|uniref:cytochrome c biogenesis protein CcdA n=1 Tax=Pseudoalteromonas xiamenensis TaxID=882626 RepID=UPI0027E495F5|nr:cytochrome c biogenesis protein CcdA [Pseudoalteromonas xiamenensis]WMN58628.1 sulfite exporter TauE/SafE family protein [Pseudoalteromonas xiamenensis]